MRDLFLVIALRSAGPLAKEKIVVLILSEPRQAPLLDPTRCELVE